MARQTGSSKTSQAKRPQKGTGRANAKASGKGARLKARGHASGEASKARIIDDRTRHDLIGVVFAVLAVVVMVAAVMPTNAIVTSFVSAVLHLSLGLGAYLLPFFLLAVGVSFLVRFERERVPARVTIGLLVVFVALLSLLSLFTPLASPDDLSPLFAEQNLVVRGGYLGAGIAWVGSSSACALRKRRAKTPQGLSTHRRSRAFAKGAGETLRETKPCYLPSNRRTPFPPRPRKRFRARASAGALGAPPCRFKTPPNRSFPLPKRPCSILSKAKPPL